jgi:hypothetical protein
MATKISGRLQIAVKEGLELAAMTFKPQLPHVEGITEEEIERLKVLRSKYKPSWVIFVVLVKIDSF